MVNRIKERNKLNRIKPDKILMYVLMAMFLLGEFVGTVLYCTVANEKLSDIDVLSVQFLHSRINCTFFETVINSFSGPFVLVLLCMLIGFGAIFQPAAILVPFFRGLGIGITLAEINSVYMYKGFALSLIMIVPYTVVSAVIIISAARESVLMSSGIGRKIFGADKGGTFIDFKLYFIKFLILIAVLAASSLIDSLLTFAFAGLWARVQGM